MQFDLKGVEVSVFVRPHKKQCRYPQTQKKTDCQCPKKIYLADGRKRISAKTKSWEEAERKAQEIRDSYDPTKRRLKELEQKQEMQAITLAAALQLWRDDKASSNWAKDTVKKCETFGRQISAFMDAKGVEWLSEVTTPLLTEWKTKWTEKTTLSKKGKRTRTRGFFRWCVSQGYIELAKNPALGLAIIEGNIEVPSRPFESDQMLAILDAARHYTMKSKNNGRAKDTSQRLYALILLMRCSGLAIQDAVTLERSQLRADDMLVLKRAKSKKKVFVPLPEKVATLLREVPNGNRQYFFHSGTCTAKCATANWQRIFRSLWKQVIWPPRENFVEEGTDENGVPENPHPHCFRHTFAKEFLMSRQGDMHDLANLLANTVQVCEKHYNNFVPSRAEDLKVKMQKSFQIQNIDAMVTRSSVVRHIV